MKRVIRRKDRLVERMLVGLLAKGHLLLEGVPGVAKTLAVETFARVVGGFVLPRAVHPDLVPADILGTRIYRQGGRALRRRTRPRRRELRAGRRDQPRPGEGAVGTMLEVMAERHVSIGGKTFPMPDPFLVLATQNPIENEGVYRCRRPSATGSCSRSSSSTPPPRRSARSSTGWASRRPSRTRC
ncbi:AAA family ATPase [Amycolatopsis halotolerans]|uniref:AAA family ATPase n=1 Tax=Amycolatopsis halotolerans TaxID=330083 RepID=UPI00361EEC4D